MFTWKVVSARKVSDLMLVNPFACSKDKEIAVRPCRFSYSVPIRWSYHSQLKPSYFGLDIDEEDFRSQQPKPFGAFSP